MLASLLEVLTASSASADSHASTLRNPFLLRPTDQKKLKGLSNGLIVEKDMDLSLRRMDQKMSLFIIPIFMQEAIVTFRLAVIFFLHIYTLIILYFLNHYFYKI